MVKFVLTALESTVSCFSFYTLSAIVRLAPNCITLSKVFYRIPSLTMSIPRKLVNRYFSFVSS